MSPRFDPMNPPYGDDNDSTGISMVPDTAGSSLSDATNLLGDAKTAVATTLGRALTPQEWFYLMNRCELVCEVPETHRSNYPEELGGAALAEFGTAADLFFGTLV